MVTRPLLLDASAIIAIFRLEPGMEIVQQALKERPCRVSSVTLTELEGKLVGKGEYTQNQVRVAWSHLAPFVNELAFDAVCREKAAFYYARKSPYQLSLGDAACLGTAEALNMDVLTGERNWKSLPDLPIEVTLIR
jgi:ribonuclease VapC